MAPHTSRQLPLAIPLYRSLDTGAGLRCAPGSRSIESSRASETRCRAVTSPSARSPALEGRGDRTVSWNAAPGSHRRGALYDYATIEADRLTFFMGAWRGVDAGATLANYVGGRLTSRGRVRRGDRCARAGSENRPRNRNRRAAHRERHGRRDRPVPAGPLGLTAHIPLLRAMNLVTKREAGGHDAVAGRSGIRPQEPLFPRSLPRARDLWHVGVL